LISLCRKFFTTQDLYPNSRFESSGETKTGTQPGSSMKLGFAIRVMVAGRWQRLKHLVICHFSWQAGRFSVRFLRTRVREL